MEPLSVTLKQNPNSLTDLGLLASDVLFGELARKQDLGAALFDAGAAWVECSNGFAGCFVLRLSLDARSTWANGIFENSRYAVIILADNRKGGSKAESLSSRGVERLRGFTPKSYEAFKAKLVAWVKAQKVEKPTP